MLMCLWHVRGMSGKRTSMRVLLEKGRSRQQRTIRIETIIGYKKRSRKDWKGCEKIDSGS